MSDIKQDVKEIVKVFIRTFVSIVVKESTKKLIKSLTQIQRKMLETRVKNMSDDQLEQYFDKNPYFKNELENTVKSVNQIQTAEGSGSWLENLQQVCESSCIQNLTKILIQQVTKMTLASVACVTLLAIVAVPAVVGDLHNNTELTIEDNNTTIPDNNGTISPDYRVQLPPEEHVLPFANFISNTTRGYVPLSVKFTDQSENATGWKWDFGDGKNSTEQNITHRYSTVGNYYVNLTVTNANGTDSTFATITVLKKPVVIPGEPVLPFANFIGNVTRGYVPLSIQFTDQSENAKEWRWNFGDGNSSTDQDPAHTYFEAGKYTVNLTTINTNGIDSMSAIIEVLDPPVLPVANFSSNVTSGIEPLTISFTDRSKGNPTVWRWDFGDRTTSTEQSPVHTFSEGGPYTVSLTVSNSNGTNSTTRIIESPSVVGVSLSSDPQPPFSPGETIFVTAEVYPALPGVHVELQSELDGWFAEGYTDASGKFTGVYTVPYNAIELVEYMSNSGGFYLSALANGIPSIDYYCRVSEKPELLSTYAYIPNAGVDSTISIIDTANDTIIKTIVLSETEQYWPYGVAANKEGTKVYVTNSYKNSVSVIDTINNIVTATVPVGNWPRGVAVTPDGSKVYVANTDSDTLSVIDTAKNTVIATLNVGDMPYGIAVTPDGTKVYVTNQGSDNVSIIDTVTNEVADTINLGNPIHGGQPEGVAVTPDGKRVYVVNFGGYYDYDTVSVIDAKNNIVVATVNVGAWPEGIAINPTGTRVYVTNSIDNTVSVIDTTTNIVIETVSVGDMPQGVSVTPDGKKVYVGNVNSGTVSVIDTANNTVTATMDVGNNPYAFGQFIVSSQLNNTS